MKDLSKIDHFPPLERMTQILMTKTQNNSPHFFRILLAYYFAKVTSSMQVKIQTHDRGVIPVNMYAMNLAPSGSGKGYSTAVVEEQLLGRFKKNFLKRTLPKISEKRIEEIALDRHSVDMSGSESVILQQTKNQFKKAGAYQFSFNDATVPAIKQARHKILMSGIGSLNLEIDEIGSKLVGATEVLTAFLELFDIGKIKDKLTKNTDESERLEELSGCTPTNMMLFGTPVNVLAPGSKTESEFFEMLSIGYGRRCFFGYSRYTNRAIATDVDSAYKMLTDKSLNQDITDLSKHLGRLASATNHGVVLTMEEGIAKQILKYQIDCQTKAKKYNEYEEEKKAELEHRYYKALKLSGAYAFIDDSPEIEESHWLAAVKLAEESGEHFLRIMNKEQPYEVLAKYIASRPNQITEIDLIENLPLYKGSKDNKRQLIQQAATYGYTNNIIIKREMIDGFEFFSGETLEEVDLKQITISFSTDITTGFENKTGPFDNLIKLITAPGFHYAAHHFQDGYRNSVNAIPGFNLIILDVDNGLSLSTAQMLLKDYKAIFATTKRHTDAHNRYRIIMPMSHTLKLDPKTYSKFMENLFNWLPIAVDPCKDIARKWESNPGKVISQDGELIDSLQFIPHTKKEEEQIQKISEFSDISALERWFHINTVNGSRNHKMLRYAFVLMDTGMPLQEIRTKVHDFNKRLELPMEADEINRTILATVANRMSAKL